MKAWTYILRCADGSYYIGSTKDLSRRLDEHKKGNCAYTSQRLPVELIYSETYQSLVYAKKREIQLKGWTRKKKEALILHDKKSLKDLSMCENETSHLNISPSTPLRTKLGKKQRFLKTKEIKTG